MKTILVPLIGDPVQNLYQLGMKEKDAFFLLEERVRKLLSVNILLQQGQEVLTRVRTVLKKKDDSLFERCIEAYAEGLGVDFSRYMSFISLFETAAHSGQIYPELKAILPGCTSVFAKAEGEFTHTRLLDFPLIGLYEERPRLYYWQEEGRAPLLTMSCEGLAPLFFQGIHGSGTTFALHHKPGTAEHKEGQSIFQIVFETMFSTESFADIRKELKKRNSVTKWSILALEKSGQVLVMDIDGPSQTSETYHLNDQSPLIFTNIPLKQDISQEDSFLRFCEDRQIWAKNILSTKDQKKHILDLLTSVQEQKNKNWLPSAATLSTVGAYYVNLSKGLLDLKEGESALTSSDAIIRFSLGDQGSASMLKEKSQESSFETSWKRAAKAQGFFDEGTYDLAYHELQMAEALMPNKTWKEIFSFYLYLWDFKFIGNTKELSLVYKKVKSLTLPPQLHDQWIFLIMRLEKKLDLSPTVTYKDVSGENQELYQKEKLASKTVFAAWMKLLYPRLEVLDVFSPHKH